MATTSTTPRKSTARKAATKAAPKPASNSQETVDENGLEKTVYELGNKGRTRGGEGNEVYWNLHEKGARGQIFTGPDVVEVKVLVVRNPNAV